MFHHNRLATSLSRLLATHTYTVMTLPLSLKDNMYACTCTYLVLLIVLLKRADLYGVSTIPVQNHVDNNMSCLGVLIILYSA